MQEDHAIFINGEFIGCVKSGGAGNAAVLAIQTLWRGGEEIETLDVYPKYPYRATRYEKPKVSGGLIIGRSYSIEYNGYRS